MAHVTTRRGIPGRSPGAVRAQPILARDPVQRLLFVSGQVGSRSDGSPEPDLEAQVRLAFQNLNAILQAAGSTFENVVDVTVFIVDPASKFEKIWKVVVNEYWGEAPHPTVTAIGVTWLYGFDFEIKVIAKLPEAGGARDESNLHHRVE